jgi:hypothetical protein
MTSSPRVRAFLENNLLLGKVGALLNALPKGTNLYKDQIIVDLGMFLSLQQKKLLELVHSVEIGTETGKVILNIKIEK